MCYYILLIISIILVNIYGHKHYPSHTNSVKRFVSPEDLRSLHLFPPLNNNPPSLDPHNNLFGHNKKKPTCRTPVCHWKCKEPKCKTVCRPWCYKPDCAIHCDDVCVPCKTICKEPKCTIRCRKDACLDNPCVKPHCEAVCPPTKKQHCKTTCKSSKPFCRPVCEPLECARKCQKVCDGPAHIERPVCSLICQIPTCGTKPHSNKPTESCEFPKWFPCTPRHWNSTHVNKTLGDTGFVNSINKHVGKNGTQCCPCKNTSNLAAAINAANSLCQRTPNCPINPKPTFLQLVETMKVEGHKHCCPCAPSNLNNKATTSIPPEVAALARYGLEQLEAKKSQSQPQSLQQSINNFERTNNNMAQSILGPITPPNMPVPGYPSPLNQKDNSGTLGKQLPH